VTRKKKRVGKYPKTFREKALERMKSCENVSALAKELGINDRCCTSGEIKSKLSTVRMNQPRPDAKKDFVGK
jgi:hypothetical protein